MKPTTPADSNRITVVPYRDRWTFLIDGKGDAVFHPDWGVTVFVSQEAAMKAGDNYLRAVEAR